MAIINTANMNAPDKQGVSSPADQMRRVMQRRSGATGLGTAAAISKATCVGTAATIPSATGSGTAAAIS